RARARPSQRGGKERAGEHRGRQHQCGAACAGLRARQRGLRCLPARSGARDDSEGWTEMHRDPPHLRAGGERRSGGRSPGGKTQGQEGGGPWPGGPRKGTAVTRGKQAAAFDGIRRLASEAAIVCGGTDAPTLDGIDKNKSAFVAPTLLKLEQAGGAQAVHEVEGFGPAATILPYRDEQDAAGLIARGGGPLVPSGFREDYD